MTKYFFKGKDGVKPLSDEGTLSEFMDSRSTIATAMGFSTKVVKDTLRVYLGDELVGEYLPHYHKAVKNA